VVYLLSLEIHLDKVVVALPMLLPHVKVQRLALVQGICFYFYCVIGCVTWTSCFDRQVYLSWAPEFSIPLDPLLLVQSLTLAGCLESWLRLDFCCGLALLLCSQHLGCPEVEMICEELRAVEVWKEGLQKQVWHCYLL